MTTTQTSPFSNASKSTQSVELRDVYAACRLHNNIQTLYRLLEERTPEQSISHHGMPELLEHEAFVLNQPYMHWYLIDVGKNTVGAVYLSKQREIGLFIFDKYRGRGYGSLALKAIMDKHPGRFLANIAPKNGKSHNFFKKHGFKPIQVTYECV